VLLHEMPQVTVAAINGACAGAGLGWACACDLRYATRSAKLNTAFLDVAVAGDMGLPWTLPRLVGAGRARELSLLPRKVTADEAAAMGLVNAAFDDDTFRGEVQAIVEQLAAKAPLARRGMKAHYVDAESMRFGEFIGMETEHHGVITATEDCKEAFRAFVDKRPPQFVGK
jgi:2-(1,2-epoxy-1,2-dihydrophenyl)acetyl-CoA isomerase